MTNNKCNNCGGALVFDPNSGELKCTHCNSIVNIEETSVLNEKVVLDLVNEQPVERKKAEYTQLACSVCGRKHIATVDTEIDNCPSCGSANLQKTINVDVEPDGIIPFKLNQDKALESFVSWVKKRKFAPNNLKRMAKTKQLKGIYYPIYNFDVSTTSHYSGVGVKSHRGLDNKVYYTKHPFRDVANHNFTNFIESANSTIPSSNFREAGNFNYGEIYAYRTEFLYGWIATNVNIDLQQGRANMQSGVCHQVEKQIKSSLKYDSIEKFQCDTVFNQISYNYLYVPMWVNTYIYKDKTYSCYINGQTGKASGTAPKSFWKIFFTVLGVGLIFGAIAYLVFKYQLY